MGEIECRGFDHEEKIHLLSTCCSLWKKNKKHRLYLYFQDFLHTVDSKTSTRFSQCSVVLASEPASFWKGKCGSRLHSTTNFNENVEVAETRCQMLEVLSFCDRKGA